jgi:hypothetical protein
MRFDNTKREGISAMELEDFLYQSPTGCRHAIDPETHRTYCGFAALVLEEWRPLDVIPSEKDLPTCKVCLKGWRKKNGDQR